VFIVGGLDDQAGNSSCNNRIKETQLIKALNVEGLTSKELTRVINEKGIDFKLSSSIEKEIRAAGAYLGNDGLLKLIEAIRNNFYCKPGKILIVSTRGLDLSFAMQIKRLLESKTCEVNAVESNDPNDIPIASQVRYFHNEDRSVAENLANYIQCRMHIIVDSVMLKSKSSDLALGYVEIWVTKKPVS
jgi:hypothetical protein